MRSPPGRLMFGASACSLSGDLFQLQGQLRFGRGLALLPLAGLVPDRAPPATFGPGGVHSDPALQLDDLTSASGGLAFGATREDFGAGRAAGPLRPPGGEPYGSAARRSWGICGDLGLRGGVERRGEFSSNSLFTALTVATREAAGAVWSAAAPCRCLSRAAVTCDPEGRWRRARRRGAGLRGCCPPGLRGPGPGARLQHQTPPSLARPPGRSLAG